MSKKKKSRASKVAEPDRYLILVLGMHRSGTSALSGMLHHLGCALPAHLMPATEDNPKGYFESKASEEFNDQLLKDAGSNWRDWRPLRSDWFASPVGQALLPQARDLLLEEFGSAPLAVFKDPRICRMVPFWAEAAALAGFQVLPVLHHRNPLEVARSLQARNGMDLSAGMLLWLRHVLDAEAATRGQPRVFTNYEQVLQNWAGQAAKMQEELDVILPRFDAQASAEIETFLSKTHRHFSEAPEKVMDNLIVSDWVRHCYGVLERWSVDGEAKADYKTLDRIREDLDAATPVFSQMLEAENGRVTSLNAQVAELKSKQDTLRNQLEEQTKKGAEWAEAQAQMAERVSEVQNNAERLQHYLDQANEAKAQQSRELDQAVRRAVAAEAGQAERGKALEAQGAAREQLRRELAQMEEAWREAEALRPEIESLRNRLSQSESALAQRRLEAEQAGLRVETVEADLADRDRALEELNALLRQEQAKLKELTAMRDVQLLELAETAGLLQQKDAQLQEERAKLEAAQDALGTLKKAQDARLQDELATLKKAQDARLAAAEADLAERDRALAILRKAQNEQSREIANMADLLQRKDAQLEEQGAMQRQALAKVQAETGRLQAHITFVESELQAMRHSTFWRMTQPLRSVIDRLRGAS